MAFHHFLLLAVVVVGATAKVLYCKDQLPCFELEFSACDENGMREVCLVANFGDECSKSATLGDSISHVCTRPAASTEDVQCDPNAQVKDTFYHDDRICHTWLAGESFSFGLKDGGIGSPKQAQLSGAGVYQKPATVDGDFQQIQMTCSDFGIACKCGTGQRNELSWTGTVPKCSPNSETDGPVAKCGEQHSCFTFDFGKCSTNDLGNMTREVCMRNNGNCKAGSGISHVCIMPNAPGHAYNLKFGNGTEETFKMGDKICLEGMVGEFVSFGAKDGNPRNETDDSGGSYKAFGCCTDTKDQQTCPDTETVYAVCEGWDAMCEGGQNKKETHHKVRVPPCNECESSGP